MRLQRPALPGVGAVPDDRAEGPGEAGRLAQDLHHLHVERHHRQPCLCHFPSLQSRGTTRGRVDPIFDRLFRTVTGKSEGRLSVLQMGIHTSDHLVQIQIFEKLALERVDHRMHAATFPPAEATICGSGNFRSLKSDPSISRSTVDSFRGERRKRMHSSERTKSCGIRRSREEKG